MSPVHCAVRSLCASLPRVRPSPARLQTSYQRLIHRAAAPSVSSAPIRLACQSTWRRKSWDSAVRSRRSFSTTPAAQHGHLHTPKPGEERKVTFIDKDGDEHTFEVADGDNLLDIAQDNDLEMEGACGGSCACSTCHVIVDDADMYDQIPEPDDDENDMLDLAFGLTETSRLGCQVKMSKELDGIVVRLPSMTRNLQASDFADKS
ncbi:2Fe-2S iron-sulfur cluster binding domain-containing protein [Phyllosticta citribraziliensis]|uniref:2Fe-2S iron-sulfur cluster binding domain-containing protein n=1 Tax=Phyllosticta citribraziliensis TaxID=989973 RepID=A0ABR1MBA4_9PEZI